jgi:poly(A) polymerase Pap1
MIPEEFMSYVDLREESMATIFNVEVSKTVQKDVSNEAFNVEEKPKIEKGLNCDNDAVQWSQKHLFW